jgi:hypothetical protein
MRPAATHKVYAVCKSRHHSLMVRPRSRCDWTCHDPGTGRGRGAAADRRSYSPITDQRKPIMMKKPVKRAMRPIPP